MKKNYFDFVNPKADFITLEKELLNHWYKDGIVDKYLHKNDSSNKYFSFQDGPITANNPMGVHHAWGRTYKDLWQRFFNMKGFKQRFQNGFDGQGLWVEVEVEKELGFKNKKDIEKFGVEKFVNLCKERVRKYSEIQTEQSKRLGYFADWDNSYSTLSDDNNYMIWHFLKVCHENGWIYKGNDSVPWCPRCETAISQHEMLTEDYKEVTHESIYIEYSVEERKNTYFLAWTTTPWTLPGNVALAVDPKKDYVEAVGEIEGNVYILVKEAAERLKLKIKKTFRGEKLIGLNYSSPFDNFPRISKTLYGYKHRVIAGDPLILPITTEEGTGIVHIATGQGAEDFRLGKKEKLPVIELIDDGAFYLEGMDEFSNQSAKKHPEIIIEFLKKVDCLFDTRKYTHRYPACWRCKTELVWKVTDEWYIAMDQPSRKASTGKSILRERMKKVAKNINWIPGFGLKRELDWLDSMNDWLISKKNRYWGLALPIWECLKCNSFEVIGSKEELKEKSTKGWGKFEGKTPHKPQIDEVKIKCTKCDGIISRIEPVGNPWLDAGIVPFSTISKDNKSKPLYLTNREEWLKWFPATFITESFPGQFKNWFYSMIVMGTVLEGKESFKSVLGFASLLAEDGRPMHKSWGNSIEFNEGADKIGVDVMRWMYVRQDPKHNLLFGYKLADGTRRKFHLKLWNIYNFFVTYSNMDAWRPIPNIKHKMSSTNVLDKWILLRLNEVVGKATNSLEKYDPYNSSEAIDKFVDDLSLWYLRRSRDRRTPDFYNTMYYVLCTLAKLLAPFTPFLADIIYTNLTKEESVHLTDWPITVQSSNEDSNLLSEMKTIRDIVEIGHSLRKENNIPVRQPLKELQITNSKLQIKQLEQLLLDELNVKSIKYDQKENKLDLKITPILLEEAKTRDLIRKIQAERKSLDVKIDQKINLINSWMPKDKTLYDLIIKKTLIKDVTNGEFKVDEI